MITYFQSDVINGIGFDRFKASAHINHSTESISANFNYASPTVTQKTFPDWKYIYFL